MKKFKIEYALQSVLDKVNYNSLEPSCLYGKVVTPVIVINKDTIMFINGKKRKGANVLYMWKQNGEIIKSVRF